MIKGHIDLWQYEWNLFKSNRMGHKKFWSFFEWRRTQLTDDERQNRTK